MPTHTLELVEAVAARQAIAAGQVEPRHAPEQPLDVLVQHLVTVALGGGFSAPALLAEVRQCWSYRHLSDEAFAWALAFVERGGESLGAYPEYHRVVLRDGLYRVDDRGIAMRHRLQVGTIVGESAMLVKWLSSAGMGGTIGQVEESFIARLKPGDCFVFAGRVLEYVRTQDMVAFVRKGSGRRGLVPSWAGGRMPLSSELADATLAVLHAVQAGRPPPDAPELQAAGPDAGGAGPAVAPARAGPAAGGAAPLARGPPPLHLPLRRPAGAPGAGQPAGLAAVAGAAQHLQHQRQRLRVRAAGGRAAGHQRLDDHRHFSAGPGLLDDVLASLNSGELAQRRFREIARVAGLVFTGYPGAPKSTRQLQASSSLFYQVFRQHDPANRLLLQAQSEVLAQELALDQLAACLARLRALAVDRVTLAVPSPLALALMVERFREQLSTERLADRLARLVAQAEGVLADGVPPQGCRRKTAGSAQHAEKPARARLIVRSRPGPRANIGRRGAGRRRPLRPRSPDQGRRGRPRRSAAVLAAEPLHHGPRCLFPCPSCPGAAPSGAVRWPCCWCCWPCSRVSRSPRPACWTAPPTSCRT